MVGVFITALPRLLTVRLSGRGVYVVTAVAVSEHSIEKVVLVLATQEYWPVAGKK
jgi:hypothetical protein